MTSKPHPLTVPEPAPTPSPARALREAAGTAFLVVGFVGRLPAAMNQLGMLLVVSAADRGLAMAGGAVAAVGAGTALSAPLMGRLVDRLGGVRVLTCALVLQCCALAGVLTAVRTSLPDAALLVCAGLVGAANPQAGSITRATWSALARRDEVPARGLRTIRLAMGFETAADESSFVIGPVVAGVLVTLLGPGGALVALALATVAGEGTLALWLARHRELSLTSPASTRPSAPGATVPARLAPLFGVIGAIGVVFGCTQTALTAVHTAAGTPGLTGPVYGAMGVTSALAGLVAPSLPVAPRWRVLAGAGAVALCSLALTTLPATAVTIVLVLLMGGGVGTSLATAYTLLESAAAHGRVTSLMTVGATCNILGVSLGSVLTGRLGDNLHHANLPAVAAGCLMAVLAVTGARAMATERRALASDATVEGPPR